LIRLAALIRTAPAAARGLDVGICARE
jgi:hypothetical protein